MSWREDKVCVEELAAHAAIARTAGELASLWGTSLGTVYYRLGQHRRLQLAVLRHHAAMQRAAWAQLKNAARGDYAATAAAEENWQRLRKAWAPRYLRDRRLEGQPVYSQAASA